MYLVRISSYAPSPEGASTASSRVWHRRHPATVEFGSIHKTATFVRSYMSKDSVAIDNMEDGII